MCDNNSFEMKWVLDRKPLIIRYAKLFSTLAPYDHEDYLQDAHLAAQEAKNRINGDYSRFESEFNNIFDRILADNVPFKYNSAKSQSSLSVPCKFIDDSVDLSGIEQNDNSFSYIVILKDIYDIIRKYYKLNRDQQRKLKLLLGLSSKGAISQTEVATILGCTRSNVNTYYNKICDDIEKKVKAGELNFRFLLPDTSRKMWEPALDEYYY